MLGVIIAHKTKRSQNENELLPIYVLKVKVILEGPEKVRTSVNINLKVLLSLEHVSFFSCEFCVATRPFGPPTHTQL